MKALARRVDRLERHRVWRGDREKVDVRDMARRIVFILSRAEAGDSSYRDAALGLVKLLRKEPA